MQKAWVKKIMGFVERAQKGEIILTFADPTHPTHNSENGKKWQLIGKKNTINMPSNSGRKRLTILGALNPLTLRPTILLTEDNCDTLMMETFLEQLRKEYPKRKIPIVVLLDNAKYNHGDQDDAIHAHILICVVALAVQKHLEQTTGLSLRRIRDALLCVTDITLTDTVTRRTFTKRSTLSEEVKLIAKKVGLLH